MCGVWVPKRPAWLGNDWNPNLVAVQTRKLTLSNTRWQLGCTIRLLAMEFPHRPDAEADSWLGWAGATVSMTADGDCDGPFRRRRPLHVAAINRPTGHRSTAGLGTTSHTASPRDWRLGAWIIPRAKSRSLGVGTTPSKPIDKRESDVDRLAAALGIWEGGTLAPPVAGILASVCVSPQAGLGPACQQIQNHRGVPC